MPTINPFTTNANFNKYSKPRLLEVRTKTMAVRYFFEKGEVVVNKTLKYFEKYFFSGIKQSEKSSLKNPPF